jgi:hypothetical protein
MKCHICGEGPPDGPSIFRVNQPGEMPSVWACRQHLGETPIADDVNEIVTLIEGATLAADPQEAADADA